MPLEREPAEALHQSHHTYRQNDAADDAPSRNPK
jgi:hypothetical protein